VHSGRPLSEFPHRAGRDAGADRGPGREAGRALFTARL